MPNRHKITFPDQLLRALGRLDLLPDYIQNSNKYRFYFLLLEKITSQAELKGTFDTATKVKTTDPITEIVVA